MLHSVCQQIWKTQQWPQDWKRSVFIPIPKNGRAKECSNYRTIALISHASKVMLKILESRRVHLLSCAKEVRPAFPCVRASLNIWKFMVHVLLKPGLENFEHYFTSVWDECNFVVVWAFLGIVFLWDWNENWPFPRLWPLLSFPNVLTNWVQQFHSIIFQDLK